MSEDPKARNQPAADKPPGDADLSWKILGLQVARKTEILALAAFVISISGVLWQVIYFVRRELIRFTLANRHVEHRWYDFVSSDLVDGKLAVKRDSEARPFPVNAGSATSHETLFTAWEIDCDGGGKDCDPRGNFVVWDDFLKAIKISNKIEVTTLADVYSGGTVSANCEIKLRDWEVAFLEKEQWIAAICSKPDTNARPQRRSISQPASSTPSK